MEGGVFQGLWGAIFNTGSLITQAIHRKDAADQQERYWNDLLDWNKWQAEHPVRNISYSVFDTDRQLINVLMIGAVLVFAFLLALIMFGGKNKAE